ncbi:MAG: hypothetical protein JSU85_09030 [Candidatus Zixiibacteriota bacterium]|nr:MAG: hypothetical protein JSU85_09030 [candidate division Zixibacteria bacterium]
MKTLFYLIVITMVFFANFDDVFGQAKSIVGVYESVSESEWNVKVDLRADGTAIITWESWNAGQYDSRTIEETVATWERGPYDTIYLRYNGIIDTLQYNNRLSRKELGQQGAIPGIWQKGRYNPDSKIKNIKLWTDFHYPCAEMPPQVLMMPEELVEVAQKNGYKQVDDFYDIEKAIDPPFVYGYKPADKWKYDKYTSAVFWCEKSSYSESEHRSILKYYLLVASKPDSWSPMKIDDIIEWEWGSFPGGLSLYEDTLATLDGFYYIDSNSPGPKDVLLRDKIISCGDGGLSIDFYEYNGRWLMRMWD